MADRSSIGSKPPSRGNSAASTRKSTPAKAAAPPKAAGSQVTRRSEVARPATRGDSANVSSEARQPAKPAGQTPNFQASLGQQQPSSSSAVNLARQFEGRDSKSLKGELPNFTAAGGQDNNCADFVSSVLRSSGQFNGHEVQVSKLKESLQGQGFQQIPAAEAQPGDVFFAKKGSHTELVTEAGGTRTIGSNNVTSDRQAISERDKDPSTGIYYARRDAPSPTMLASR